MTDAATNGNGDDRDPEIELFVKGEKRRQPWQTPGTGQGLPVQIPGPPRLSPSDGIFREMAQN